MYDTLHQNNLELVLSLNHFSSFMSSSYSYFIFPVRTLPACWIPVRAMYILRISLVPWKQAKEKWQYTISSIKSVLQPTQHKKWCVHVIWDNKASYSLNTSTRGFENIEDHTDWLLLLLSFWGTTMFKWLRSCWIAQLTDPTTERILHNQLWKQTTARSNTPPSGQFKMTIWTHLDLSQTKLCQHFWTFFLTNFKEFGLKRNHVQ